MYKLEIVADTDQGADPTLRIDELDSEVLVDVSINEEGDLAQWRCATCGDESGEDEPGDDEPPQGGCDGSGKWDKCLECDGSSRCVDCDGSDEECPNCDGHGKCQACDDDGDIEVHDWERIPLHWVNSVGLRLKPDTNEVQVSISVGDPRGAFVMSVYRTDEGELFLSVPYERMTSPHMPLTQRHAGFFKIG